MFRYLCGFTLLLSAGFSSGQSAISLNGTNAYGRVKVGSFASQNTTWEGWVRLPAYVKTTKGGPILFRWGMYSHGAPIAESSSGTANSGNLHGGMIVKSKPGALTLGQWHHLATVFGGQSQPTIHFYLDGKLVGTQQGVSAMRYGTTWELVLGAVGYSGYSDFLAGELDEVRLSTVQRYTANFVPQRRFVADAATYGLWHFDSGQGAVALDSSANKRHFALAGGYKWVQGLPSSLTVSSGNLSLSTGGKLNFQLDAGIAHGNNIALLLGSLSGTTPGINVGAYNLPLNVDSYFSLILTGHNYVLPGALQFLDPQGRGKANLNVPAGLPASLVGKSMSHAYVILGLNVQPTYRFTSAPVQTLLVR